MKKRILFLVMALAAMMILAGCGQIIPNPNNHAPEFATTEPTSQTLEVQVGGTVDFSVEATDADNDNLSYVWTKTTGTLSATTGTDVTWTAPAQAGTATVTVKVTDGKATTTHAWTITVKNSVPSQVVHISGYHINTPTTWETGKIYVLDNWVDVDSVLTIQPGAIVKFTDSGNTLTATSTGSIKAQGTVTQPIYFTSINDDSVGGDTGNDGATVGAAKDWNSVIIKNTNGSVFDYCYFSYGGSNDSTLSLTSTNTPVTHCVFAHNNGEIDGALNASDAGNGTVITNNTFYDNIKPVKINVNINVDDTNVFHNPANADEKNDINAIYISNYNITRSIKWQETEVAFVMDDWKSVENNGVLTLGDDVVIKLEENSSFDVGAGGTLTANASTGHKITFTSIKDDSAKGDTNNDENNSTPGRGEWEQIAVRNNGTATFNNCLITYGGYNDCSVLYVNGSKITLTNSTLAHNDSGDDGALNLSGALSGNKIQYNNFYDNEKPMTLNVALPLDNTNVFHNPSNPSETNDYNGIYLYDYSVESAIAWTEDEVPFVVQDWFAVDENCSLTLGNNVIIKVMAGGMIETHSSNIINMTGTGVFFTSYKDDAHGGDTNNDDNATAPAEGDWDGIHNWTTNDNYWFNNANILYDAAH